MAEHKTVYVDEPGLRRTLLSDDDAPGIFRTYTEQDMTAVLENNKILRENQNPKSDMRLIARGVPISVYEKSELEEWDDKDWAKWLNDPDNAAFRIWRGRV